MHMLNRTQPDNTPSMNDRENYQSGAPWEPVVGYSRAVRKGKNIYVSGTTSIGTDGIILHPNDAYNQTRRCLANIEQALAHFGARMSDVVRTRMFVTDISQWEAIGRAHGEYFREIRPATSMVEVKALIDPDMMVEIEAEAILD